jgi:PI-3-kinase-related kinase SMG-1
LDDESSKEKFEGKNDEVSSLNKVKIEDENQESPHPNLQTGSRVAKGNV